MPDLTEAPRRSLTGAVIPAVAAAALVGAGALVIVGLGEQRGVPATPIENCILEGAEEVGGPIELVDSNGSTVTQADFAGAPAVIYFGFTHCPDVCPTTMYALAEALTGPDAFDVRTALISVDPQRDTPQVMGAYAETDGFPPGLVGLTGSEQQIEAAKRAFHVYAARAPIEGEDAIYNVDHSSLAYVLDGQWRTRAIIRTTGATPMQYAQCIAAGLDAVEH
jgi:protein SCO1/2